MDSDLTDLAALADGSLPAERRAEVERRVAASPELSASLARQRRALAAVHAAAGPAPAGLRARLERLREPRRRPLGIAVGLAGAAVAVALVLLVGPGGADSPSVADAAVLATRPPSAGPPPRLPAVEGVRFPRWDERFHWRATGVRSDRLGDHPATTVYYRYDGHRVGYTIVGGQALAAPSDAARSVRGRTAFHSLRLGSRTVVTWRRKGHTCVLSGAGIRRGTLLTLADY
jgi:hypothetical protein